MATTTYAWASQTFYQLNDDLEQGNQYNPAVTALAKGGLFSAWSGPGDDYIQARIVTDSGAPLGGEFGATSTTTLDQAGPSVAGLPNGRAVIAFTDYSSDSDGDIRARMFKKDGDPVFVDFAVQADADEKDFEPDVTALPDGGFAVVWTHEFLASPADNDIRCSIFNADGSPRITDIAVENSDDNARLASVAGLADGRIAIAWQEFPDDGGDWDIYVEVLTAFGEDTSGTIPLDLDALDQTDVQLLGLQDGGFAAAWVSQDIPGGDEEDIAFAIFEADGTIRGGVQMANYPDVAGSHVSPTLTQLSNGYIVVGWTGDLALTYQIFDTQGLEVADNLGITGFALESEIAALSGGRVASVTHSLISDGSGASIQLTIDQLVRTTTGDGTNETLNGDDLADHMFGGGGKDKLSGFNGKDTLEGGAGDDVLRGGAGRDQLIGGTGADKLIFSDVLQSRSAPGADLVKGFEDGVDRIDVAAIDARAETAGDQAFVFGTGAFTGEGQIRAVQSGADTIVRFNVSGSDTAEMEIVLKNFTAADVDATDFVL